MIFHRSFTEDQFLGDLAVGLSRCDQASYFAFAHSLRG